MEKLPAVRNLLLLVWYQYGVFACRIIGLGLPDPNRF
jgi:hypothetical protein